MSLGQPSTAIQIQTPSNGAHIVPQTPTKVTVHPAALFSILDHYLRRNDGQDRVLGTLMGVRLENEVEVRSSFAVLHSETAEQMAVDMEYHHTVYELYHKANPKEVIVGWYSTGSNLNTFSALIQNFYTADTSPHQAIHLALNTGLEEGEPAGVQAYVSSPVGVSPKPENCVFVPVPVELRFHDEERSGFDILYAASASPVTPLSDLELLERNLQHLTSLIDRVIIYVQSVLSGEVKGNKAVGRYLMDTLGLTPDEVMEKSSFNVGLQDTLMVSYLANLIRSQAELASRLALVAL